MDTAHVPLSRLPSPCPCPFTFSFPNWHALLFVLLNHLMSAKKQLSCQTAMAPSWGKHIFSPMQFKDSCSQKQLCSHRQMIQMTRSTHLWEFCYVSLFLENKRLSLDHLAFVLFYHIAKAMKCCSLHVWLGTKLWFVDASGFLFLWNIHLSEADNSLWRVSATSFCFVCLFQLRRLLDRTCHHFWSRNKKQALNLDF